MGLRTQIGSEAGGRANPAPDRRTIQLQTRRFHAHHDRVRPLRLVGLDELVPRLLPAGGVEKTAAPIKMDVVELDNAYVVKAEIPGVTKDEIQVSIEGNQVTIGAEVKRETETKDGERAASDRALRAAALPQRSRFRRRSTSRRATPSTKTACWSSR